MPREQLERWVQQLRSVQSAGVDQQRTLQNVLAEMNQYLQAEGLTVDVQLTDQDNPDRELKASVQTTPAGITVAFEGYGDHNSAPGYGAPIFIEVATHPIVRVWADIHQEDPTHTLSLEGAQEKLIETVH